MIAIVTRVRGRRPILAVPERRKQIEDTIRRDLPMKGVADACEVSTKIAYAAAKTLGFSRMYVTDEERREILRRREEASRG